MRTLIENKPTTLFASGEPLPVKSEYFWLITQGVIKTYTYNQRGKPSILGFWGTGDLIGGNLSSVQPYKNTCLSSTIAISISLSEQDKLASKMLSHALQIQQLTYIIHNNRVSERVWLLLQWLGSKFGRAINQGKLIDFRITHRELAEATGTTRITVTKILNQFERDGLIMRPKTKRIILTV